ncbi:MAG: histidine kinase [Ponticaulis sp.]|nr:histidine kinase [Ponticaulis sp.]|tara:strand:- start:29279 stop:31162 length:1884 start_codon:yes stop_codon:yes gene_type:complete
MAQTSIYVPPYLRLTVLIGLGIAAFIGSTFFALQSADGISFNPADWRSVTDTPGTIWASLFTGFLAYLISAWIWALKPDDPPAILFAASGLMTLGFCFASIGFDLAVPLSQSTLMSMMVTNALTASAFGIIMPCLFLIYPGKLPFWRFLVVANVLGFGGWTLISAFGPQQNLAVVQLITFCEMIAIIVVVIWQVLASRSEPRRFAIANFLGVSTIIGSGGFIATVAAPISFGFPPLMEPSYAFAFFLIIYVGLAIGLLRYRLFDLGTWAYRLAFYVSAAIVMILLDLALVTVLALDQGQAIGISLFAVAIIYLPLRDILWRRILHAQRKTNQNLMHKVLDAALQPTVESRRQNWQKIFMDHFEPLQHEIVAARGDGVEMSRESLSLYIPPAGDAHAFELTYPNNGRSLFSKEDVVLAEQMISIARHARESRHAYDRGVAEERTRIARDIHDNISAQLMRALHSQRDDRKDTMIRETLSDLRDVINNAQGTDLPLENVLADLRAETAERLDAQGVTLKWALRSDEDNTLSASMVHAIRSVIREAISNTLKHAGAKVLSVDICSNGASIELRISDDGTGFDPDAVTLGHGLNNMKARIESLGGDFVLKAGEQGKGANLVATLPMKANVS